MHTHRFLDEKELRAVLDRKTIEDTGKRVDDREWKLLKSDGYVKAAMASIEGFQELVYVAGERIQHLQGRFADRPRGQAEPLPIELTPAEHFRSIATANALARRAGRLTSVVEFRDRVLGEPVDSEQGLVDFILSPALAVLRREDFRRIEAPFLGHQSEIVSQQQSGAHHSVVVRISPPGDTIERFVTSNSADPPTQKIAISMLNQPIMVVDVLAGSVLDELRLIGEDLHRRFLWDPVQAVRFVLTGDTPEHRPIVGYMERQLGVERTKGTITLEIDASVSAETVMNAYRQLQQHMVGQNERGKPKDNRPLGARAIEVFSWTERKLATTEGPFVWADLGRRWNDAIDHLDDQKLDSLRKSYDRPDLERSSLRFADEHDLKRAFENAERRILRPSYQMPGDQSRSTDEPLPQIVLFQTWPSHHPMMKRHSRKPEADS